MPSNGNHDVHDDVERRRERLRRRLQELRERCGLRREYIGKLERGAANPTLRVTAQLSHGMGMTLTKKNRCGRKD